MKLSFNWREPSFLLWFLTPLITFAAYLSLLAFVIINTQIFNPDPLLLFVLLSPIIGCFSLAWWLLRSEHPFKITVLLAAEAARFGYIAGVAFIFWMIMALAYEQPTTNLSGLILIFFSIFFYLIPDAVITICSYIARIKTGNQWLKIAMPLIVGLIGAFAYIGILELVFNIKLRTWFLD